MRKVKFNQVLVLIAQVNGIGAANGIVTISAGLRVLFKR